MSPRKLATVLLPSRTRQGLTQEELPKGPTSRGLHRRPRDWRQLGTKDPGECILGLEWERIDLATSRITLYRTKSGKPRGVPMNSAVYDALVALQPGANGRHGRLFQRKSGGAWARLTRLSRPR
jgi:hypothetical protein